MQLLVFILAYPFLWVLSRLPFPLFYRVSDLLYFLLYRVVGYRKKVVRENLRLVFPEKSEAWIKDIEKKFYRHMCDLFLEMVKTMGMSLSQIRSRFRIVNPEFLDSLGSESSTLLLCSHYANWEWVVSANLDLTIKGYAVYQKIKNPYFDGLIRRIRGRWNTALLTQKEAMATIVRNHKRGVRAVYGMVNDQSPQAHLAQYWTEFLGVPAPIFTGAESLARKLDLPVVFIKVIKVGRGRYEAEFIPITSSGKQTAPHEITDSFLRLTEDLIRERPEYYLWTHRRWKHRDKVPADFLPDAR